MYNKSVNNTHQIILDSTEIPQLKFLKNHTYFIIFIFSHFDSLERFLSHMAKLHIDKTTTVNVFTIRLEMINKLSSKQKDELFKTVF